jgi:hypothetical protein
MSNADVGSLTLASECRYTTFCVPRAAIAPLVGDLGAAIGRRIPAGSAVLKLLVGYLASALDTEALVTPELQQLAVTHVHDLLALALGATRDAAAIATGRGARAARLRAAKAFVMEQLSRHDLSAATVAAHLGVTPRYVHMLFATEPASLSEFVLASGSCARTRCLRTHVVSAAPSAPSLSMPDSPTSPISTARSAVVSAARPRTCGRSALANSVPAAASRFMALTAAPWSSFRSSELGVFTSMARAPRANVG